MEEEDDDRCPHIQGCSLYPLLNLAASLKVWQTIYCNSKFMRCSRYQRSLSGESVPAHLLPDGSYIEVPAE